MELQQITSKKLDQVNRIMVALDYASKAEAAHLVDQLEGIPCYMKVGMQLFYHAGPQFVEELKKRGYRVFLDLKLHDIPNTVKGGAQSITALGVDMFNVHAAGGINMMQAALEGVDKGLTGSSGQRPLVIGVTQLTSTNQTTLNDEIGIEGSVQAAVLRYAKLTEQAGLDGVVASAQEVKGIKAQNGSTFITVTPGIRPAGAALQDQSRVMTPKEAFAQGSDYLVIGRPITADPNPRKAFEKIIEELS
jgi:orotidine-5'-phosphate decarboxylase